MKKEDERRQIAADHGKGCDDLCIVTLREEKGQRGNQDDQGKGRIGMQQTQPEKAGDDADIEQRNTSGGKPEGKQVCPFASPAQPFSGPQKQKRQQKQHAAFKGVRQLRIGKAGSGNRADDNEEDTDLIKNAQADQVFKMAAAQSSLRLLLRERFIPQSAKFRLCLLCKRNGLCFPFPADLCDPILEQCFQPPKFRGDLVEKRGVLCFDLLLQLVDTGAHCFFKGGQTVFFPSGLRLIIGGKPFCGGL